MADVPSKSLLPRLASVTPSRTLSGHLFPNNSINSYLPGPSTSILPKRSHHSARKDISSDNTLHNLCTQSHRAHVRLCLTPVSKSRLRPSCNKQYKAAGLTGRTRKICPKKRSTETTSVAFSNSPCKFRLISLPIY